MKPTGLPMRCAREGDELVVRLHKDTLAFAAANHPEFWDGQSDADTPNIRVTNKDKFLAAIVHQLNEEGEDGSTIITRAIDKAITLAVESGCDDAQVPA